MSWAHAFRLRNSMSDSVSVTLILANNKVALPASSPVTIHEAEAYLMMASTASSWTCLSNHFLFFSVHTGLLLSIQSEPRSKANTETPPAVCLSSSNFSIFVFIYDSRCLILAKVFSNTVLGSETMKWLQNPKYSFLL